MLKATGISPLKFWGKMLFRLKLHTARCSSHVRIEGHQGIFMSARVLNTYLPWHIFLKSPEKHSSANSWIKEGKGGIQEIWDQIKKSVDGFLKVYVLGHFSCICFFATLWTVAFQAPLSMGFSSQEYWSGCHALFQGIFPTQGSKLHLLHFKWILYPLR